MGKLKKGINGPFTGKIGTVHGSSYNGVPYVKGPHKKRTKDISDKERANRIKFDVAQKWLSPLTGFVREGFKGYSPTAQGFVAAKSHLLRNAMKGEAPDFSIDPARVQLSYGNLDLPQNITLEKSGPVEITIRWDAGRTRNSNRHDQVMWVAYDLNDGYAAFNTTYEFRHKGSCTLTFSKDRTWHFWFAMNADDRSRQSNSVYLGEVSM
jgi:hypothetical protein